MDRVYEMDYECDIPEWAVCAIEYRDNSGLTKEDEKTLEEWKAGLRKDGYVWDIVFTSDTNSFNPCPEFGLACATVRATVVYYRKED